MVHSRIETAVVTCNDNFFKKYVTNLLITCLIFHGRLRIWRMYDIQKCCYFTTCESYSIEYIEHNAVFMKPCNTSYKLYLILGYVMSCYNHVMHLIGLFV